jgi:DNA polymerase II
MPTSSSCTCFLLTAAGGDSSGRFALTLHGRAVTGEAVRIQITEYRPSFFVPRSTARVLTAQAAARQGLSLKSLDGEAVDCLRFSSLAALQETAHRIRSAAARVYESDVHPVDRFLMERHVQGCFEVEGTATLRDGLVEFVNPRLHGAEADIALTVLSVDIETHVAGGTIYSIACSGTTEAVFMVGQEAGTASVRFLSDETALLRAFLAHVAAEDPDIIVGWNVVDFDLSFIQGRCTALGVPFSLGRSAPARVLPADPPRKRPAQARVPGRVVLDVPVMLRASYHTFEEYSLDFVAAEMLGKRKLIRESGAQKIAAIDQLYASNKAALAQYNLEDARLTREIFDKAAILPDLVERAKLCGHRLDRVGGSVSAFDYLYLPRLHQAGYVARDVADAPTSTRSLPGGHVMDSTPGRHENVLVFDFRSLYPSIIVTFCIDPLGLASQASDRISNPVGPSFARDEHLLPGIITELLAARDRAKQTNNAPLSQAIKIIMNSFYGVLGTTGCRFFAADLAATITGTGQYLLRETSAHIEQTSGCPVIYGDTDSLFVLLGPGQEDVAAQRAAEIADEANQWLRRELKARFGAESALLLQSERPFRYFFVPTIRGSTQGSKKRYCGAVMSDDGSLHLAFTGLESARTDWTDLAQQVQHELYLRVFTRQPVEEYLAETVAALRRGELDDRLVYRKRVRKPLSEYTHSLPPHVKAAQLLEAPPHVIAYVITRDGPQPVEQRTAALDYEHYITTQIRPVFEQIEEWSGTSWEGIITGQQSLF